MLIRTGLLLVATLSILIFSKILTLEERVILILIVSPTLYNLAKAIRQEWERTSHTLVSVGFLSASGIALILMPLDTLVPSDPAEVLQMQSDSSILKINPYYVQGQKGKRWVDVGFSGTLGNYERRVVTKDCDGNITSDKRHKVKIQNATLDASYNIGLNEGRFGFGFRGITGMSEARTFPDEDFAFQAINPYIALDKRKMGFSIGVMAFIYNYEKPSHEDFLPSLYLRIGKIDKVHFDFSFFQNAGWLAYPEPSFYSSLNYGFGDLSGAKNLQIGLMSSADDDATGAGFLLGFRHPLGSTPLLVDCTLQLKKYIMASLGLRYRFNLPPQKGISK
ncbi:MAG: hypothetical protein EP344_07145 [Bacteroidetes bacterium]|nr:MAG: hypothetical protein EP344_07145 [Bacteroidota bacterium]